MLTAGSRRSQAQAQVDAWNSLRGPGLPPLRIVELDSLELPDFSAGARLPLQVLWTLRAWGCRALQDRYKPVCRRECMKEAPTY